MTNHHPRPCPRCGASTDSLKAFRLPLFLLFLGVAWSLRHGTVVACPRCMRRELGRLTLVNLLPANILWLVLLLPWYGVSALRTFKRGHSPSLTTGSIPGGYRDPAAPAAAPVGEAPEPWNTDPALAPYADPSRPGVFDATFLYTHRGYQRERLPVRLLRREGEVYRALVLEGSPIEPGVHPNLEVFVRPSAIHPPLVWLPPAARDNLQGWEARCDACGFDLAFVPAFEIARAQGHLQPGREPPQLMTQCPSCGGPMTLTRRALPLRFGAAITGAARRWRAATLGALGLALLLVGVAGASSERAGVAATYLATWLVGFPLGAWLSADGAARENKPWYVPLLVGVGVAVVLFALALVFFEAIFPAL